MSRLRSPPSPPTGGPGRGSGSLRRAPSPAPRRRGSATCAGAAARGLSSADHGERLPELDLVTLHGEDRLDPPRDGGLDLVVRLLDFDLDEQLACRDALAFAFVPAR